LGYVLVGVGIALSICGTVTLLYLQKHSLRSQNYASYPVPLILAGTFFVTMAALVLLHYRKKKREPYEDLELPPPPPPPPPPP
jgi:uncharacterized membrane protein YidH (DUF202 family)